MLPTLLVRDVDSELVSFTANISRVEPAKDNLLRPRMPELDTLRGVAVLLVLFFHGFGFEFGLRGLSGIPKLLVAATLPGWAGVNLFFVLSGFLITGILIDAKPRSDFYRRFYYRRALRILPLYYATLALLLVLSRTGLISRPASWGFLGLSSVFLANVTELLGVPMQYGVLWTLAIEEHFYLFWPAVVRFFSPRNIGLVATGIFIFCPSLRAFYLLFGHDAGKGYTWLYADGLALGAILAVIVRGPWGTPSGMRHVTGVLITASLVLFGAGAPFGIFLASRSTGMVLRVTALNLFFGGILSLALLIGTSRWKAIVCRPILQFLGEISYGVYLLHMLIFDLVDHLLLNRLSGIEAASGRFELMVFRFFIGVGGTIVIAFLSRRHFEQLFLRSNHQSESNMLQACSSNIAFVRTTTSPQVSRNEKPA